MAEAQCPATHYPTRLSPALAGSLRHRRQAGLGWVNRLGLSVGRRQELGKAAGQRWAGREVPRGPFPVSPGGVWNVLGERVGLAAGCPSPGQCAQAAVRAGTEFLQEEEARSFLPPV